MSSFSVYDVRCNYKRNPLGMDDVQPRISWKITADARSFIQKAYQIQVAREANFLEPLLWDTGKVHSDRSTHHVYDGSALQSRTRYFYRVRVWDREDRVSNWSDTAYWETAFLAQTEWQADWIKLRLPEDDQGNEPIAYLRKSFSLRDHVATARIYASSLGLYQLFLNGQIADDTLFKPGWTSYEKRLQYQTFDVTGLLSKGENVIGAMLGNGWYKGNLGWASQKGVYGSERALLMQLHVIYTDGSEEIFSSDETWKGHSGPLLMSEIYHGEIFDARKKQDGWNTTDFDDAQWKAASHHEHTKATLLAQENEPTRIIQTLKPIEVITTPRGETVLDLGQNMVGMMRFTVNLPEGSVVTLQHAEVLDRDGNFYTGNLRSAKQTIRYICRGDGPESYEPSFSFQGFRYVWVDGVPKDRLMNDFIGCVIHTDLEASGTFSCSDELINQLQHNIVWGQKGNFLDVPTDCPQRDERLGWTGDAQVFIRTAAFNMHVAPFFEKWLKDLAADQKPDGGVPHVIPNIPKVGYASAAWGDAAVICPWTVYECYGDTRILESQYASMKAWVEYMRAQGENEYLWNTGKHFGDWLALDAKENSYIGATPDDLIATAFYAYSTGILAKTARILGRHEDALSYSALQEHIAQAFRQEFVTPNGRVASPTQTAYVLALMFDLLEEKDRARTARMLADHIEKNGTHLTTGFVGTPYLCHVLSRFGYTDLAYKLLFQKEYPSWLYSVTKGATTIWEHWDGIKSDGSFWNDDMNSYNHYAYGAIGDWLYRVAVGIDTMEAEPGYKAIRIKPHMGEQLSFAEATHQTMYGEIQAGWKKEDHNRIELSVVIPANTTAEIILSPLPINPVMESGSPLMSMEGLHSVAEGEDGLIIRVGSGSYTFNY
ncbi:family 78 glycoside hydrolase catalytic domain [Paenibacillus sp. GCM10027628]|uniref:family 78 glycoside hydrolase catalytic domain n=1 Tax=Paenibacillus sp. GCM10027628 TaxID=3273413 RepID=UPI00363EC9EB